MLIHDDNVVTAVAEATAKLGRHQFPIVMTESVELFLQAVAEETGYTFDVDSPDLDGAVAKLGSIGRLVAATLRDTANPTMLKAGYKANVIPATAEAVIDCRVLPGRLAAFEREVDELIGPDVSELLPELTLAQKWDLTALEAARNVHTHPTLSEAVQEAFHGLVGHMINM